MRWLHTSTFEGSKCGMCREGFEGAKPLEQVAQVAGWLRRFFKVEHHHLLFFFCPLISQHQTISPPFSLSASQWVPFAGAAAVIKDMFYNEGSGRFRNSSHLIKFNAAEIMMLVSYLEQVFLKENHVQVHVWYPVWTGFSAWCVQKMSLSIPNSCICELVCICIFVYSTCSCANPMQMSFCVWAAVLDCVI